MDGLTTNGILLMNPKGGANNQAGIWREISVCGNVFGLRKTRSAMEKGKFVSDVTEIHSETTLGNSTTRLYCRLGLKLDMVYDRKIYIILLRPAYIMFVQPNYIA